MSKENVEVMENFEIEPEIAPVEVEAIPTTPTTTEGFNVSAVGRTMSTRIGDAALNMIAGAAVMGAANGCAWVAKKVGTVVKKKFEAAKEKKALKELEKKAQAEIQEAETADSEENSEE